MPVATSTELIGATRPLKAASNLLRAVTWGGGGSGSQPPRALFVYPTGLSMSTLTAHTTTVSTVNKAILPVSVEGLAPATIEGLAAVADDAAVCRHTGTHVLAALRHAGTCSVLAMEPSLASGQLVWTQLAATSALHAPPSALCINKHFTSLEVMFALENGSVWQWLPQDAVGDAEAGTSYGNRCLVGQMPASSKPVACHYSHHPRLVMLWDAQAAYHCDLRMPGDKLATVATLKELARGGAARRFERVMSASGDTAHPFQSVFTTPSSLCVLDHRRPNTPLVEWHHQQRQAPTFLCATPASPICGAAMAASPRTIIATCTPDNGECVVYQCGAGTGEMQGRALGTPWSANAWARSENTALTRLDTIRTGTIGATMLPAVDGGNAVHIYRASRQGVLSTQRLAFDSPDEPAGSQLRCSTGWQRVHQSLVAKGSRHVEDAAEVMAAPAGKPELLPFKHALLMARALRLKGVDAWKVWSKSAERPANIPHHPETAYKHDGWQGWVHWLGKGLPPSQKEQAEAALALGKTQLDAAQKDLAKLEQRWNNPNHQKKLKRAAQAEVDTAQAAVDQAHSALAAASIVYDAIEKPPSHAEMLHTCHDAFASLVPLRVMEEDLIASQLLAPRPVSTGQPRSTALPATTAPASVSSATHSAVSSSSQPGAASAADDGVSSDDEPLHLPPPPKKTAEQWLAKVLPQGKSLSAQDLVQAARKNKPGVPARELVGALQGPEFRSSRIRNLFSQSTPLAVQVTVQRQGLAEASAQAHGAFGDEHLVGAGYVAARETSEFASRFADVYNNSSFDELPPTHAALAGSAAMAALGKAAQGTPAPPAAHGSPPLRSKRRATPSTRATSTVRRTKVRLSHCCA